MRLLMTSNEGIESVTTGNNVSCNVSCYRTILFIEKYVLSDLASWKAWEMTKFQQTYSC